MQAQTSSGRLFVSGWEPEYGRPYRAAEEQEYNEATEAAQRYRLVEDGEGVLEFHDAPSDSTIAQTREIPVAFVDGVMRTEAHLGLEDKQDARIYAGMCGAVGAGAAVWPGSGLISPTSESIQRYAIWEYEAPSGQDLDCAAGCCYQWHHSRNTFENRWTLDHEINALMQDAEVRLVGDLASEGASELVVADGPLRVRGISHTGDSTAVVAGYTKTHHTAYLPPEQHRQIPRMGPGQRSSIFAFASSRYSFYLRLPDPPGPFGSFYSPWSAITRIELPWSLGQAGAVRWADTLQALIPVYASEPHLDPRAPQNLVVIAALEKHLRRRLGNVALALRMVRQTVLRNDNARPDRRLESTEPASDGEEGES